MSTQPQDVIETTETTKVRREVSGRQIGIIVGALALGLVLLWFLVLRGDGGGEEPGAAPGEQPTVVPFPEETQPPGDGPGRKGPVETFEVFAPRDPFEPLVDLDAGGGAEQGDVNGDTTGDTGDTDGDTTGDGGDTDGDGDVDADDGDSTDKGDSEDVEGHTVELISTLDDQSVQIQVDDTVYKVEEGEDFAENFRLVSVSNDCATVLFGDDQFTICEGQEILK
jgi:hypothetical protein